MYKINTVQGFTNILPLPLMLFILVVGQDTNYPVKFCLNVPECVAMAPLNIKIIVIDLSGSDPNQPHQLIINNYTTLRFKWKFYNKQYLPQNYYTVRLM